jgi:hypothetical protein
MVIGCVVTVSAVFGGWELVTATRSDACVLWLVTSLADQMG